MNRRGFLQSCLALAAAPAIVRAESIMRIWTPPQEIVLPHLEFWGAQIEMGGIAGQYVGSVRLFNRTLSRWELQQITMVADNPNLTPVMRIDPTGLSVESGGKVLSKIAHEAPFVEDYGFAKVSFPTPDAYLTIGSPQGIGCYGTSIAIQPPIQWPKDKGLRYPLTHDFKPVHDDTTFKGVRRVRGGT